MAPSVDISAKHHEIEVWASLMLSDSDCVRVRDFFVSRFRLKARVVVPKMHITVYHARRLLPGLAPLSEEVNLVIPSFETRFMVMAPGGENPRPDLEPAKSKVGIRIHKQSPAIAKINTYRSRLLAYETKDALGCRRPSGLKVSHMTLLKSRSGIQRDLTSVGSTFRETIGDLYFDRFEIRIAKSKFASNG